MTRWLTIVGMGEDGVEGLSASARRAIESAEVVIGSQRMFAMLPPLKAEKHLWPQPFSLVVAQVKAFDAAIGVTGLVITKLDGTAKGGVIAAIARTQPKPLRFIGVGENRICEVGHRIDPF